MKKYYNNMILCSELDFHCLLCKESFETVADVEKHIRWEKHRHSIKHQNNVPKYKQDMHKIADIYYCEICNSVVKSEDLQGHVKSESHKKHKTSPGIVGNRSGSGKRDDNSSIRFPNLTINRLQWHGIEIRKCMLCDDNLDNVNDHISTTKHMIHIIQSQIVENGNYYFRKIDENKFVCFLCFDIINNESVNKHSCNEEKSQKKKYDVNQNEESEKKYRSLDLLEIIADLEKDKYDINIKEKTAKCKLCDVSVDATIKGLSKHTEEFHEDTIKYRDPVDSGKRRSDLAKYGKENFIKLNEGGRKGYCSLCDVYLSPNILVATEHVNGSKHNGHLEIKGLRARRKHSLPGYRVQPIQHFLKNMFHAKKLKSMFINFSVCIDVLSFTLIKDLEHDKKPKRKCFCCDIVFDWDDLKEHLQTRKHENAFASADVLLIEDEFIRIIRPGLFHCGFCNEVLPFWEVMEKHIATDKHSFAKKKNELACTLAMQLYTEEETNGAIKFSDDLLQRCMELGLL